MHGSVILFLLSMHPDNPIAALIFNLALCASYNVSIPDFLGCSPLSSTGSKSITTTPLSVSTAALSGGSNTLSLATVYTVTELQSAFTAGLTGSVAQFTGGPVLTGSCTVPQIESYSISNVGILEYPWVGCSNQNPGCCAFSPSQPGPINICPSDYFTTNGACCPS